MRKKFFRLLLKLFKNWDKVVFFKYVNNLRIFKTETVTFVIVNSWRKEKVYVYYFYMPENMYLNYDTLLMYNFKSHLFVYHYIKKEVTKIEEDEVYRRYRIARYESTSSENEK